MRPEPLTFHGCAPTPLASYLKALGILRLISSDANHVSGRAADPEARGWWENERFRLSTTLDHDSLRGFFLHQYAPSPIMAPWNGRAGFLEGEVEGDASDTSIRPKAQQVKRMESSRAHRFENLRRTIAKLRSNSDILEYNRLRATRKKQKRKLNGAKGDVREALEKEKKKAERQEKGIKGVLLPYLRSTTDREHLAYIDTCYVLSTDNIPAPILVGGGVDGSKEFGSDFLEALGLLLELDSGTPNCQAEAEFDAAVFAIGDRLDRHGSLGLLTPMQSGLKSTTGFEVGGDKKVYPLNSWDVVLAMEGTVVFAGSLTRRWSAAGGPRAAFPFTFESIGAGAGNLSSADPPNRRRGEIWTPLWPRPATFSEMAAIFTEGRLTLGRRTAWTGLDAARSVGRIGQSRGISSFERYALIQSDNKMPYHATPLGRFNAPDRPRNDLIEDLEAGDWLERAQRLKSPPAHARSAMRRLEDALFQMTDANRAADGARNALMALGKFVDWLATSSKARESLGPPPLLSSGWIKAADDNSPEFRVAVALAGIGLPPSRASSAELPDANSDATDYAAKSAGTSRASPMAGHFAAIDEGSFSEARRMKRIRRWSDSTTAPNVVWGAGSLVSNMISVLERRLTDAGIRGLDEKPLAGATHAPLVDVSAFLSSDFDDARCAALLAGLIWGRPPYPRTGFGDGHSIPLPFAYAALKPVFTPDGTLRRIEALVEAVRLPVPPGLVARLRAGGTSLDGRATDAAVRTALVRARGSGIPSPFDPARAGGRTGAVEGCCVGAGLPADRLAAALLIPVGDNELKILIDRAYPGAIPERGVKPTEVTTDAA